LSALTKSFNSLYDLIESPVPRRLKILKSNVTNFQRIKFGKGHEPGVHFRTQEFVIISYLSMYLKSKADIFKAELKISASKSEISSFRHIVIIGGNIILQYLTFGCAGII
jgi:hypothetical protein